MLAIRSGTLGKLPRRMFLSVSSRNERSTRLSQLDEVGEVQVEPWALGQPCLGLGVLVGVVVVQDQMDLQRLGHVPVDGAQEDQELFVPVLG